MMPAPGPQKPDAVLRGGRAQEVVDLAVLGQRLAQVGRALDARLDQVVAVDAWSARRPGRAASA